MAGPLTLVVGLLLKPYPRDKTLRMRLKRSWPLDLCLSSQCGCFGSFNWLLRMGGQTWLVEALAAAIFTSLKLGTEVRETATVSGKASLSTSRYPKKRSWGKEGRGR